MRWSARVALPWELLRSEVWIRREAEAGEEKAAQQIDERLRAKTWSMERGLGMKEAAAGRMGDVGE